MGIHLVGAHLLFTVTVLPFDPHFSDVTVRSLNSVTSVVPSDVYSYLGSSL